MSSLPSSPRPRSVAPAHRALAWVHGGVRFVVPEAPRTARLGPTYRGSFHPSASGAPLGDVRVEVVHEPTSRVRGASRLSWARGSDGYELVGVGCRAWFRPGRPGRLEARLSGPDGDLAPVLAATAALVGQLAGGLLLHASGVVVGHEGYLFVGPSGAGKSTAVGLVSEGLPLTWDRALVFPWGDGYRVASVAGGSPAAYRLPAEATFDLAGIARIHRGEQKSTLEGLHPVERFLAVRESVFWVTEPDEDECGKRIEHLARTVPVAVLRTVLGSRLDPLFGRWRVPSHE